MSNQNKKVILTIFSLQGGGAERFVLTLAKAFKKMGFDVHIICFKEQIDYELPEIQTHFVPYQKYRLLPKKIRNRIFASILDRYVKRHICQQPHLVLSNLWQVDQVLSHSQLPNRIFVIHNTLSKEKLVHTYLTDKLLTQVYSGYHVVAVSQGVHQDFRNIVHNMKSLTTIYNPIDRTHILQSAIQIDIKSSYPKLADGYLIHVGKFKTQKDHITLIQAYAKTNQLIPLVLVGTGPLQAESEALCQTLGIAEHVFFAGFQSNPYPWIAAATAMVLSSIYEGFGLVIGEALALGIPVISTDCESGPRELLPTQNLVPIQDSEALSKKMHDIMRYPSHYVSDFNNEFLPEKVATSYLKITASRD